MNFEISFKLENAHNDKFKYTYHCHSFKDCEDLISRFYPSTILQCVIYDLTADKTILMYDDGSFLVSPQIPYYFVNVSKNYFSIKKLYF